MGSRFTDASHMLVPHLRKSASMCGSDCIPVCSRPFAVPFCVFLCLFAAILFAYLRPSAIRLYSRLFASIRGPLFAFFLCLFAAILFAYLRPSAVRLYSRLFAYIRGKSHWLFQLVRKELLIDAKIHPDFRRLWTHMK